MEKLEDFALQNTTSDYCKYCTDEQGKLLPWEKILNANADYFKESQGITEAASVKMATDLLRAQPAWKAKVGSK
jgi:hypothetical protein